MQIAGSPGRGRYRTSGFGNAGAIHSPIFGAINSIDGITFTAQPMSRADAGPRRPRQSCPAQSEHETCAVRVVPQGYGIHDGFVQRITAARFWLGRSGETPQLRSTVKETGVRKPGFGNRGIIGLRHVEKLERLGAPGVFLSMLLLSRLFLPNTTSMQIIFAQSYIASQN